MYACEGLASVTVYKEWIKMRHQRLSIVNSSLNRNARPKRILGVHYIRTSHISITQKLLEPPPYKT